jgi:hypothetical protein
MITCQCRHKSRSRFGGFSQHFYGFEVFTFLQQSKSGSEGQEFSDWPGFGGRQALLKPGIGKVCFFKLLTTVELAGILQG